MTVEELIAELKKLPRNERVAMHLSGKYEYAFVAKVEKSTAKTPWITLNWEE